MHSNINRANLKVSFANKSHRRTFQQSDSDEEEYQRHRNGQKRKNQRSNNYNSKKQISISSQSSESGVIRFEEQNQKQLEQQEIIPWISNSTKNIKDSLLRLHNQIIEFYNYIKPSKKTHTLKLKKFSFLQDRIAQMFPKVQVVAFGSFATQLYLPDGDVDVAVLTGGQYQVNQIYNKIYKYLVAKNNSQLFTKVEHIKKSKVPLIKFQYQGIHFDISVDKADGISQVKYVQKINELFPQFKYLTLVFKCLLRIRGLADTYTGGIGSFLLSCMLLYYLKTTAQKQHYYNLGEHVIEFMKFYALNEDYWKQKVLYVRQGKVFDRNFDGTCFSCMSPQDETHDIGRSAFKIKEVFHVLKNRCRYLLDKNFASGESILRVLVNPSDQAFRYLKVNKND